MKLAAKAPQGFQTSFMEAYGTQELSSIPIEAGKDKDLKVKVTPPANVTAGDYPVAVQASAEGAAAETQMHDVDHRRSRSSRSAARRTASTPRPRPARPRRSSSPFRTPAARPLTTSS